MTLELLGQRIWGTQERPRREVFWAGSKGVLLWHGFGQRCTVFKFVMRLLSQLSAEKKDLVLKILQHYRGRAGNDVLVPTCFKFPHIWFGISRLSLSVSSRCLLNWMESLSVIGRKEKICDVSCGRQDVDQTPNASERSREMERCSCRNGGECCECLFQLSTMLLALLRCADKSDTRHKQPESSSREMLRRAWTFSGSCSLPEDDDVWWCLMSNILLACVHRVFPLFCCATYKEALDRLLLLQQENEVSSWYMFSKSWRIISSAATFFPENCVFFVCIDWERLRVLVWVLRMTNTLCV